MADTTYATVDDLKARINVAGSVTDFNSIAQSLLNAAARELDRQTRAPLPLVDGSGALCEAFSASASLTRYYDDDLSGHGVIPLDDCLAVSAVTRNGQAVSSTYWLLGPANTLPYTRLHLKLDVAAPLVIAGGWYGYPYTGIGLQQIGVTGIWGYCTAANRDPLIGEVTLDLAARAWERIGKTTPQTELLLIDAIQSAWQNLDGQVRRRIHLLRRDRAALFA